VLKIKLKCKSCRKIYLYLLPILFFCFILYGCAAFMLGFEEIDYVTMGWMSVIENDSAKKSGFKRLQYHMQANEDIRNFIARMKKLPDYIQVGSGYLNLAYLDKGVIFRFKDFGRRPRVIQYWELQDELPYKLVQQFREHSIKPIVSIKPTPPVNEAEIEPSKVSASPVNPRIVDSEKADVFDENLRSKEIKPHVFVQLGHSGRIDSAVFSPDGRFLLSGSWDNTLKLWDIATGKEIRTFMGHSSIVRSVSFSPDGHLALSGSSDETLKLWDVATGKEIRTFIGHSSQVFSVSFSPDGHLALSGSGGGTLKLWDVATGKEIRTFMGHSDIVNCVSFSPDGSKALSGSWDRTLKLWDIETGKEIRTFMGHSHWVESISFSPDGNKALSGSHDGALKLWDIETGKEIHTFMGHSNDVSAVNFSPDGSKALSGSRDGTFKLWDIKTGKEIQEIRTIKEQGVTIISSFVTFSSDGRFALVGGELWDITTGKEIRTFRGYSFEVTSVSFSPDGRLGLAGSSDGTLKLWDVATGKEIRTFMGHYSEVTSVSFSPDGRLALSGSSDSTLKLWDVAMGKEIRTFMGHYSRVDAVSFSPDGSKALSGSLDNTLKLWDIETGKEIRTFVGHSQIVRSVSFSPDGSKALSGSQDRTLKLWDVATGKEIRTFMGHSGSIISVNFSPDGRFALSGSSNAEQIFNLRKEAKSDNQSRFAFSGSSDAKLWDIATGKEIRTFRGGSTVTSAVFSSDGRLALLGLGNGTLELWDIATGREIRIFKKHSYLEVTSVSFSPDGRLALLGSKDSTIRLWNLETGKEVLYMVSFEDGEWISLTPEGYYTASLNGAKYINVTIGMQVYGIEQYEKIYHRPDIVTLAIKLGDSKEAIAQLSHKAKPIQMAALQPPALWFISPKDGYETHLANVEVQVKTENVADQADAVTFFLNQRPVATLKGKRKRPTATGAEVRVYTQKIPLLEGYNYIQAEVRGKAGAVQRTPLLSVVRKGVTKKRPDLYYLGIGVAQHPQVPLKFPAKDVTGLEKILKQQEGKVYQQVMTKTLTDQEAIRGNLINAIETFFEPAKRGDIAILFISGHGMNIRQGYHFVTYDANVDQLAATGASWEIFNAINDLKAHVLLLADTCHAGNIIGNTKWQNQAQADPNQFLREANLHNVVVFASSSGADYSIENPLWGHGAFTKALIDGLGGEAAYRQGVVKLSFLQDYVRETVRELTENAQTPTIPKITGSGEFFELVLAKK